MKITLLFLALVVGTTSLFAVADDDELEMRQIRRWVSEGKILSLQQILDRYPSVLSGRLLDLEIEQKKGRILYEFEILHSNGRVIEYKVDARNGELLKQEEKD